MNFSVSYIKNRQFVVLAFLLVAAFLSACKSSPGDSPEPGPDPSPGPDTAGTKADSLNPHIKDDYTDIADFAYHDQWGSYNVHDPSVIKVDSTYYMFTTDVSYGDNLDKIGIQVRKSDDLVQWEFVGWAFDNGILEKELDFMEQHQPGYRQESIWAPFVMKTGDEFRLYYALPGNDGLKLAAVGLATSESITGPWHDDGIVISTTRDDPINSIDPSVIVDRQSGRHWMSYGSYSAGIYMVELDPETGMLLHWNDTGHRIAYREYDNQSIEGADIIYNPDLDKYFIFISYGWLEDSYNVRVGRADSPEGPYFDYNGKNMANVGDNLPRITAEYRFDNHPGWQGIGGNCTLNDEGDYYFISQGRLASNKYLMDLHVRRMLWTPDGWPVISPERYDAVPQQEIANENLQGEWEYIELNSTTSLNQSAHIKFMPGGTIKNSEENSSWSYANNLLKLSWNDGESVQARVFYAWDWENERYTIIFTGLNSNGVEVWGKKVAE